MPAGARERIRRRMNKVSNQKYPIVPIVQATPVVSSKNFRSYKGWANQLNIQIKSCPSIRRINSTRHLPSAVGFDCLHINSTYPGHNQMFGFTRSKY